MGKVIPLVYAKIARRRFRYTADAGRLLDKHSFEKLCQYNSYVLVSCLDLGLHEPVRYSTLVFTAKQHGLQLATKETCIHVAADGPAYPVVLIALMPIYTNRIGKLLRVSNTPHHAIIEVEEFRASQLFSPHAVFAFNKK